MVSAPSSPCQKTARRAAQRSTKRVSSPNAARASTNRIERSNQGFSQISASAPQPAPKRGRLRQQQHERVHRRAARPDRAPVRGDHAHAEVGGLEHGARPQVEPDRVDLHRRGRPWNTKYASTPSQHAAPTRELDLGRNPARRRPERLERGGDGEHRGDPVDDDDRAARGLLERGEPGASAGRQERVAEREPGRAGEDDCRSARTRRASPRTNRSSRRSRAASRSRRRCPRARRSRRGRRGCRCRRRGRPRSTGTRCRCCWRCRSRTSAQSESAPRRPIGPAASLYICSYWSTMLASCIERTKPGSS